MLLYFILFKLTDLTDFNADEMNARNAEAHQLLCFVRLCVTLLFCE